MVINLRDSVADLVCIYLFVNLDVKIYLFLEHSNRGIYIFIICVVSLVCVINVSVNFTHLRICDN